MMRIPKSLIPHTFSLHGGPLSYETSAKYIGVTLASLHAPNILLITTTWRQPRRRCIVLSGISDQVPTPLDRAQSLHESDGPAKIAQLINMNVT